MVLLYCDRNTIHTIRRRKAERTEDAQCARAHRDWNRRNRKTENPERREEEKIGERNRMREKQWEACKKGGTRLLALGKE